MPELYFKGKEFVYNHHLTVPYRPLETQPDKSVGVGAIIAEWYLGESPSYHVWLFYRPDLDWLKSRDAALTLTLAEKIAATDKEKRHKE
jgi:hypothetical protein